MQVLKFAAALAMVPTCSAAADYVHISNSVSVDGKSRAPMNVVVAVGETSTINLRGDRNQPEVLLTLKPVLSTDNSITVETGIAVNRMLDTPAPTFDKREVQVVVRSKLGEPASIETASGVTYQWLATRLSDEQVKSMKLKTADK